MKAGKIILLVVVIAVVATGTYFLGMKSGADLVRNGLIANFPTLKNVILGAKTEVDSSVTVVLTKNEDEELFNYLKGDVNSDSLQFSIPYYGRYGIDLARSFRALKNDDGAVEVWLPPVVMQYCELKFDGLMLNGKSPASVLQSSNSTAIRKKLYAFLIPVLQKNKSNQKAASLVVTKAMMFYFMPYKLDLKVYIDNNEQQLPLVPGVNQSVDDAVRQAVGK